MEARRNYIIVAMTTIAIALLLNINTVFGQKSSSLPSATEPPVLQATFEASKDTYVTGANGNSNTNFGTVTSMAIGTSGTSPFIFGYHTLVDFDLSSLPSDVEVISATLRLSLLVFATNSSQSPNAEIMVYSEANTESWGENTATWNNRPTSASQGDPANPVDGMGLWEDWDVTNIVTAWTNGAVAQNGIKLFSTTTDAIDRFIFNSREGGSYYAPKLIVSYRTLTPTETPTPTPTLPVSGSCPGTLKIYASSDSYTVSSRPSDILGNLSMLVLSTDPDRYMFLHFPLEQVVPSNQYIYSASIHLSRSNSVSSIASPWNVFVYTPHTGWDENTLNWLNQPGPFLGLMKAMSYDSNNDEYVIDDLGFFANLWHQGVYSNDGLGISLQNEQTSLSMQSSESSSIAYRPYMQIQCGSEEPTPTPTPTLTPTPTPTPTSAPKTINFIAANLEVTQGIQKISNSVRLVEGKRTFVRFYVDVLDTAHVPGKIYRVDAELRLYRGNSLVATLLPSNSSNGFLNLPYTPPNTVINYLYLVPDNSFIFEIPSDLTSGNLRMVGNVNLDWKVPETWVYDNDVEVTVDFEPHPQFGLRVYRVRWQDTDDTFYTTTYQNIKDSLHFARQALPIPDILPLISFYKYDLDHGKGAPDLDTLNKSIAEKYAWDKSQNGTLFQDYSTVRYYALVGGPRPTKLAGLAHGIPANVASGWYDANWVFTHELGHTFNRHHAPFCRAKTGCRTNFWGNLICPDGFETYPYTEGWIGPYQFSVQGFYYDKIDNFHIRSSEWKDIMTYCDPTQWMSDFTYHRIMDYLDPSLSANLQDLPSENRAAPVNTDNLLVSGLIDMDSGALDLSTLFVIPDSTPFGNYTSGDFAIVLRASNGTELARYWFTPALPDDAGTCTINQAFEESHKMSFTELVPYNPLTAQVDIESPDGSGVLTSITSGVAVPSITVASPNGGEILASDTITVTWNASDADGDNLFFNVQYSADNGSSWDMVAMNIQDSQAFIDRDNIRGSSQALVRVYASDGIHTSSDTSNAIFIVANATPSVEITNPVTDTFALQDQTLTLTAFAADPDLGVIGGDYLTWYSDVDGVLGYGSQLSLASLSVGTHQITVFVDDGDGGVAGDSVQVTIYADASQIPTLPAKLKVGPTDIVIESPNPSTAFIQVYNANNDDPIPWTASSSESWLELSSTNGTTLDLIFLNANIQDLPEGVYSAVVTITNTDNPTESFKVNVYLIVRFYDVYLPIQNRDP